MPARSLSTGIVLCLGLAACSPDSPEPPAPDTDAFLRRPSPVLHLAGLEPQIRGAAPGLAPELARWSGEETGAWTRSRRAGAVLLQSPRLALEVGGALRLRARLRPGGATRVELVPLLSGELDRPQQRAMRTLALSLERDADPDTPVEVEADLGEVLRGNFGDTGAVPRLEYLRIRLPGADPERVRLHELSLSPDELGFARAPAGVARVDRDGVVRPGWFLNAGAALSVAAAIEPGARLRWHESDGSRVDVRVRGPGRDEGEALAAPEVAGAGAWRLREAALDAWAGSRVELEFRATEEGRVLIGDPRIVSPPPDAPAADVIVYLIDTLRADRLGSYGGAPDTSPTLDRLATEGVRFAAAYSNSSWTKPAIPTLMTGIWPTTHRVGTTGFTDRLPESLPLLQERFRRAGWRTGSFSASPLGTTLSALDRGFDAAYLPRHWEGRHAAGRLHATLLDWIDEEPDRPFVAYVHTLDVHDWFWSPDGDRPRTFETYDRAVRGADAALGELLAALGERGRDRRLLIAVVSDHGESLGDHDAPGHGTSLYESQVRIPLIFWAPWGIPAGVVEAPVGLADVPTTLLGLFELAPLPDQDGASLQAALGGGAAPDRAVPAALLRYVWRPRAPRQYAWIHPDGRKLIRVEGVGEETYALGADPDELRSLGDDPALSAALDGWLAEQEQRAARLRERHGAVERGPVDAESVERLRALGYLE